MDNQQILEHLDDIWTFGHEPTDEEREAVRVAMDIVDEYSKIGGWIPMEEKLPPDGQKVLLSCKCMMVEYVTVGTIKNGNRGKSYIVDQDTFMRSAILAWQPLPEAYHG